MMQVGVFSHLPSAILKQYEVYYLHPKHSFYVIQLGLYIDPDFPLHVLSSQEWTHLAKTSYIPHLNTRLGEIANPHQFVH